MGRARFRPMTNLAKDYRALLAENFAIELPEVVTREQVTRRHAQIPCAHRGRPRGRGRSISPKTIAARCASRRQVGCTLTCSFCHTGTQKLVRNLTAAEIVGQIMVARDDLGEWPEPAQRTAKGPRCCPTSC